MLLVLGLLLASGSLVLAELEASDGQRCAAIVVSPAASALARLAGRELRRYLWHSTDTLAEVYDAASAVPDGCHRIVVAEGLRAEQLGGVGGASAKRVAELQPSEHLILTQRDDPLTVLVAGGDGQGALYAAYFFAHEVLGVHFSIAGDVLPAANATRLPDAAGWGEIDLADSPRFPLRGLQPFYNFAEGPDWWSDDHWRAVLASAAKMRMNMVALHTYSPTRSIGGPTPGAPAGGTYSTTGQWQGQPQCWIGTPGGLTADGNVTAAGAYGVAWASTAVGSFSIQDGRGTSGYPWGGSLAFASECHANPQVFHGDRCNDSGTYSAENIYIIEFLFSTLWSKLCIILPGVGTATNNATAYAPVFAAAARCAHLCVVIWCVVVYCVRTCDLTVL